MATLIILPIVFYYQNVVALIFGVVPMSIMDQGCQLSGKKSIVNFMNVMVFDRELDREVVLFSMRKIFKQDPKFFYKLVNIGGDYFYESMTEEETLKKAFLEIDDPQKTIKNQDQMDQFVQDNINVKLPVDGPLWRMVIMKYDDPDGKGKSIMIWKSHHSFCDGVSMVLFNLAISKEFDRSYFVKSTDLKLWERIFVRCCVPFQFFYVAFQTARTLSAKIGGNFVTNNKKKLNGIYNCKSSNELNFNKVKALSKHLGMTINDIVASALSISVRRLFKEYKDQNDIIKIVIPVNIRFGFPPSREATRVENKITALPLNLPLCDDFPQAKKDVCKVTKVLKNNFFQIYTMYALTLIMNSVSPNFVPRQLINNITNKITLGFSNVPGPIKPMYYLDA